jgi:chromosome segregation ATPase
MDLTPAELQELGLPASAQGTDDTNDQDVRLWAQNQRFQAAVMKAMEHSVGVLQDRLREKVTSLAASERSREDLGVGLAQVRSELQRAVAGLARSKQDISEAVSSRKLALAELSASERETAAVRKRQADLEAELLRIRKEATDAQEQATRAKNLFSVVESDLKIATNQNVGLRAELQATAAELRAARGADGERGAAIDALQQQLSALKQQISDRDGEITRAQAVEQRLSSELSAATAAREATLRQWEAAAAAMQQRDAALRALALKHGALSEELRAERAKTARTEKELDTLADRHGDAARAQERDAGRLAAAGSQMAGAQAELARLGGELELARTQIAALETEAQARQRGEATQREQAEAQRARASALMAELEQAKRALFEARAEQQRQNAASEASEGKMRAAFTDGVKQAQEQIAASDNERHMTKVRLVQLEDDLRKSKDASAQLDSEYRSLVKRYEQVHSETRTLEDELERATHRANRHQHETAATEKRGAAELEQYKTATEVEITALKAKLSDKHKQYDALSAVFMATQQKVLAAAQREKSVFDSAASVQSQLALAQALRDRFKHSVDRLQENYEESVKETGEARLNLRKSEATSAQLQETVADLSRRLNEAQFYERAKKAEFDREISELRAELARARSDGQGVTGLVVSSQRERAALEAHAQVQGMKLAAAQQRLARAQDEIAELRQQLRAHSAAGSLAAKQFSQWNKQFEVVMSKELAKRTQAITAIADGKPVPNGSSARGPGAAASLGASASRAALAPAALAPTAAATAALRTAPAEASGGGGSSSSDPVFVQELVSELRAELSRASAVSAERLQEVLRLRQRLNAVALSDAEIADREGAYVGKVQVLVASRRRLQDQLMLARGKAVRAEAVAASLEHQLQRALAQPAAAGTQQQQQQSARSTVIDYSAFADVEPSAALRAVIAGGSADDGNGSDGPVKPGAGGGPAGGHSDSASSLPSLHPLPAPAPYGGGGGGHASSSASLLQPAVSSSSLYAAAGPGSVGDAAGRGVVHSASAASMAASASALSLHPDARDAGAHTQPSGKSGSPGAGGARYRSGNTSGAGGLSGGGSGSVAGGGGSGVHGGLSTSASAAALAASMRVHSTGLGVATSHASLLPGPGMVPARVAGAGPSVSGAVPMTTPRRPAAGPAGAQQQQLGSSSSLMDLLKRPPGPGALGASQALWSPAPGALYTTTPGAAAAVTPVRPAGGSVFAGAGTSALAAAPARTSGTALGAAAGGTVGGASRPSPAMLRSLAIAAGAATPQGPTGPHRQ